MEISRQLAYSEEEAERVVFLVEFFINFMSEPEQSRGQAVRSCSMAYLKNLKVRLSL